MIKIIATSILISILLIAITLIISGLIGWISLDKFAIMQESGLRVLAEISVLCCLICVIINWEI